MRDVVNALWLDDSNESIANIREIFEEALSKRGYKLKPTIVYTVEEAKRKLEEKNTYIDFFLCDLNLSKGTQMHGLDFLKIIRSEKQYKEHFILYSNQSDDEIVKFIYQRVKDDKNYIKSLINFSYLSIEGDNSTVGIRFNKSIDIALNKWDELNALRGIYSNIFANCDYFGRILLSQADSSIDYLNSKDNAASIINKIDCLIKQGSLSLTKSSYCGVKKCEIIDKWHEFREKRNVIVHNTEFWDSNQKIFIIEKDNIIFKSSEIISKRKELLNYKKMLIEFFDDLCKTNPNLSLETDEYKKFSIV